MYTYNSFNYIQIKQKRAFNIIQAIAGVRRRFLAGRHLLPFVARSSGLVCAFFVCGLHVLCHIIKIIKNFA